jgi:hypothetical protein
MGVVVRRSGAPMITLVILWCLLSLPFAILAGSFMRTGAGGEA